MLLAGSVETASPAAPRPRILFVDDEQAVLDGLQDQLMRDRKRWDMVFALGGRAALVHLEARAFDIVVSDVRMPDMEGTALLEQVKRLHPGATRILLSGEAEQSAVLRAIPVAHQFLSKPCKTEALRTVLNRSCELQALLHNDAVRRAVGGLRALAPVPRMFLALTTAIADPNVDVGRLSDIVSSDPAMTAKVLQLVNSAYFGFAQKISSVKQAITYLGVDVLKGLALTTHVFESTHNQAPEGFSLELFQETAVMTAAMARTLVADRALAEEAASTSLIHDLGKAVIAMHLPEQFAALRAAELTDQPPHQRERDVLGASHAELGAYLLGVWGLPFDVVEAVAYHHRPSEAGDAPHALLTAVHVADELIAEALAAIMKAPYTSNLDLAQVEKNGLTARLPSLRADAHQRVTTFFSRRDAERNRP